MTSKEFILWLQGFTEGVHEFNITPAQWDILKGKLSEVNDELRIGTTIVATPEYGTITYNPSTSTTNGYSSGSAWHYTISEYNPPYTTGEGLDDIKIQHNED